MNAAHWHLALNHIPVVGTLFVLCLFAWAVFRRSDELKRVSLGATIAVALLTIPVYMTGEPAFEAAMEVLEATPEDEDPLVKAHETAAAISFSALGVAAIVAIAGLVQTRGKRPLPQKTAITLLIVLFATAALMGRTANFGGQIRHPEIRAIPPEPPR